MSNSNGSEKPQPNLPCKKVLKLPEGYEYTEVRVSKELIQFYCNTLETETEIAHWVKIFGEISFIEWRIGITYKNLKGVKCKYRIDYRCQHGRFNYSPHHAARISKITGCPVRLIIKRIRYNSYSEKLNTLVQLRNNHNHELESQASLKYRDVSPTTKNQLLDLYIRGYSPLSAHAVLHFNAFMSHGSHYVNDIQFLPDLPYCYNLFCKEYKEQEAPYSKGPLKSLIHFDYSEIKERLQQWVNNTNGFAALETDDDRLILTLVTPLMKRVHASVQHSREVMYVDKIISQGIAKYCIYVFSSYTVVGQLPLFYIITSTVEPVVFEKGLHQLLALDSEVPFFYKQGASIGPRLIIINENPRSLVVKMLKAFWPNSKIIISFQYVFSFAWKCLNYKNYDFIRQDLLVKLKEVMLAKTEEEYLKLFKNLRSDYPFFYSKVSDLWSFKKMFCACYHKQEVPLPNNCTISVLQNLKNSFLKFSKLFTLSQLIDFIISKLDDSYCKRLRELTHGCINALNLNMFLPKNSISFEKIKRITTTAFIIKSVETSNCFVDIELSICSCDSAAQGLFCDHQCALVLYEIEKSKIRNESFSDGDFKTLHFLCSEDQTLATLENNSDLAHKKENLTGSTETEHNTNSLKNNNKRTADDLIQTETMANKRQKLQVTAREIKDQCIEIACNEVLDILEETVDDMTTKITNQEITPSDVRRVMGVDQNPFSENLRNVFEEIIVRVKNNPSLKSAATDFCDNYKKFCKSRAELKCSLTLFGERNFSACKKIT